MAVFRWRHFAGEIILWIPRVINTDKNPTYGEAITELKKDGLLPKKTSTDR